MTPPTLLAGRVEIRFADTRTGARRAYRYDRLQSQWFPVSLAEAESLLDNDEAVDISDCDTQSMEES